MSTAGENDARFSELYIKMYPKLYQMARSAFRNHDIAQDVVQETFLIAFKKLDAVLDSPSPEGWLVKALRNVVGNTYHQQARLQELFVPLLDTDQSAEPELSVRTKYGGSIDDESLELLISVYCENHSYQEAADELGISLSACKKRIQRAKAQLKTALEAVGQ